ncbi:MAG: hypothetical protein ACD_2C00266G0012 [uncultured bacterium (gcode 4)]|uniref:Lipoprotein n=1 Tax=uncultured bacterium (gcode 4) TaxID=1234023 RepID=K2FCS7_9BACT|nr:MAG: hypothetical protein ACD_2C00266G0012 [uncultured bacterium (gcode 4)]
MRALYAIFFISISSFMFASCSVQSGDDAGKSDSANEDVSLPEAQSISVFVDWTEQKWSIAVDGSTKVDISKLKENPDIIANIDWEEDCASSNVSYTEEIQDWPRLTPQVFDVTIDLTRFGKWPEMELLTENRINQVQSLVDWELYDGIKMNEWDSMILRFLWTRDYWVRWKNIPLDDRIMINLAKKSSKSIKISNIECLKNKRKKIIYLKINKSDMAVEDSSTQEKDEKNISNADKVKDEVNSKQKFVSEDTQDVMEIVKKEFDIRYLSNKYAKWTYFLEFLDQSDVLDTNLKNVKTFIFSDANFQLHPNFRKNYANPNRVNLDQVWDFNSDVYNKYPRVFSGFYANLITDPYVASIKQKCKTSKPLYIIWTKNWTNKYFDDILENFYTKILPACKITFN